MGHFEGTNVVSEVLGDAHKCVLVLGVFVDHQRREVLVLEAKDGLRSTHAKELNARKLESQVFERKVDTDTCFDPVLVEVNNSESVL